MKAKQSIRLEAPVVRIKSTKDKVIAITEDGNVTILNAETLEQESVFKAEGADFFRYTNGFDISYDGRYLAFSVKGTPKYQIWDIALKKMVLEVPRLHSAEVYSLNFSPYEQKLASGGMDGKSFVFDFASKKVTPTYGIRNDFISAFAWNPNKKHIAIAGYDKEIRIHNISDTENHISITGLEEPIVRAEFLSEKELAVFYREGQILVFDAFAKKTTASPKKLNDGVSVFERTKGCIYISGRERNIRLLDAHTFDELSENIIKTQSIASSAYLHSENILLVGCLDGSISLYELDSDNKELEELLMSGNFAEAYSLVESNPFLKEDDNFSILEEAWQMSLSDIIHDIEDGKMDAAKKMAQSYMQIGEKRLVLQTVFKQFEEFNRLKYAIEHSNHELMKSLIQKNNYFKLTKLYQKIKNII